MNPEPNPAPDPAAPPPHAAGDDRSHFLAHMGHDLRAPLTNILALAEALRDGVYGGLNHQQAESLNHIRDNGHRMLTLITDLVDLARFETGGLVLECAPCGIMEACRQGLDLVRGHAKSKKVTLECRCRPESVTATADARRLRQMMAGIAGGAVACAPAEGCVVLRVEADAAGGKLWLQALTSMGADGTNPSEKSIRDAASSTAALGRLRRMSRVSVSLVEKLVHLHGGTFSVVDGPEGSITITAGIPMNFPDDCMEEAAVEQPAAAGGGHEAAFILLADDEEIIRTITKDYLESIGYRVACATNGREALDLIQAEPPDLVIMDMQMPVLDGLEAMQEVRRSADPRIARMPLISLSGLATPGHRERSIAAGANRCLAKPFGIKDLEHAITETLAQSRRRQG